MTRLDAAFAARSAALAGRPSIYYMLKRGAEMIVAQLVIFGPGVFLIWQTVRLITRALT